MRRHLLTLGVVLLVVGTACSAPVTATTTSEEATESQYQIEVSADGDAVFSLVTVYDLTDDDERAAFDSLEDDEEAKAELATRFSDRIASVAETTGVDGAAVVGEESIEVDTTGDRAIVTLSVNWEGMADSDGETVTVSEPFASGFESDRPLVISAPEGSTVVSTSPEAADIDGATATWNADTDLETFEAVFSTEPADEDEMPGFGVIGALGGLIATLLAIAIAGRRHH